MNKDGEVSLMKSMHTGNDLIVYKNYSFYCKRRNSRTNVTDWYCSTHNWRGCNARIKMSENYEILTIENGHTHPPAKYSIAFIKSHKGSDLLLHRQYTYFLQYDNKVKRVSHWRCSTHSHKGCKARITLNEKLDIRKANFQHNHIPLNIVFCNGKYYKL
ncbi:unnamed protein product, partial [Iphiclides podalirius]